MKGKEKVLAVSMVAVLIGIVCYWLGFVDGKNFILNKAEIVCEEIRRSLS